ncbi:cyclophilin-like domain-containing protein [Pavlovales sp. CCMP2436]|nr:cyclophilin-like domain-containing protein [Pavlovales sp. CCMP2436]
MRFYRIIDRFIDQAGVNGINSIWDGAFDDDPGGLALHHDRDGLLSSANSGPDSNTGHFSIVVAPAPHLDGSYTIFGEV